MEEKVIVLIFGAITTIAGAIKSYYDYKAKVKAKEIDIAKIDVIGAAIEQLSDDFKTDQIIILEIQDTGKYATDTSNVVVTYSKPRFKDLTFEVKDIKEVIEILKKQNVLALQKVYQVKNQPIKELLFKHSFVSCYIFYINSKSALFILYQKETVLSEFDKNDIVEIVNDISNEL